MASARKKSLAAMIGTSTTRNTFINQTDDGMGGVTEDFSILAKRMSIQ